MHALEADSTARALVRDNPEAADRAMGLLLQGSADDRGPRADRLAALSRSVTGSEDLARDAALFRLMTTARRATWWEARKLALDATAFAAEGKGDLAARKHAAALADFRKVGDLRRVVETLESLGALAWRRGDGAEGLHADREALVASRILGDRSRTAVCLERVAEGSVRTGDLEGGRKFAEESRGIHDAIGDREGAGASLALLAEIAVLGGDLERAVEFGEEAAAGLEHASSPVALSRARTALGDASAALGDTARALALAREEVRNAESRGDARAALAARRRLADRFAASGNGSAALGELAEVLRIEEARQDRAGMAATWNARGAVRLASGDAPGAAEDYTRAEEAARSGESPGEISRAIRGRIAAESASGRIEKALASATSARARMEQAGDPYALRDVHAAIAGIASALGRYAEANESIEKAIALDERNGIHSNLAADHVLLGRILSRAGKSGEAHAEFSHAIDLARDLGREDILAAARQGLADGLARAGAIDSALAVNALAVEAAERAAAIPRSANASGGAADPAALLGSPSRPYEARIDLLARRNESGPRPELVEESLAAAEKWKTRALIDLLSDARIDPWSQADPAIRDEHAKFERGLLAVESRIRSGGAAGTDPEGIPRLIARRDTLRAREREVLSRAATAEPQLAALDGNRVASLAALRGTILRRGDALLLEYVLGDSASWLWAVTKDHADLHRLPARGDIESQVLLFRRALADPSPSADEVYLRTANLLYRSILEPAGKAVRDASEVYIVPDGPLLLLPFEALLTEPRAPITRAGTVRTSDLERAERKRGEFLADLPYAFRSARIRYAPSAALFLASAAGADPRTSAAKKGDGDPPPVPMVTAARADSAGVESALRPGLDAFFRGAHSAYLELWTGSRAEVADRLRPRSKERNEAPAESLRRAREQVRKNSATSHPYHWARWILLGAGDR